MYEKLKEALELVALVAASFAFYVYLSESDARKKADQLQTLQLSQLCQSLASTVDGKSVWNYQEPRKFSEWDKSNAALDERIAFLERSCAQVPNFILPTRELRAD